YISVLYLLSLLYSLPILDIMCIFRMIPVVGFVSRVESSTICCATTQLSMESRPVSAITARSELVRMNLPICNSTLCAVTPAEWRSVEHTSELQSRFDIVL